MKYIKKQGPSSFDLTAYETYLEAERSAIQVGIKGDDLLADERFSLSGRGSFHDARISKILLREDSETGDAVLSFELKGPYFDRYFCLEYMQPRNWDISLPGLDDDLLIHEVRREDSLFVHEIVFANDHIIIVPCMQIYFKEVIIS